MRIDKSRCSSCGEKRGSKLLSLLLVPLMIGLVLSTEVVAARKQFNLGPGGVKAINEFGYSVPASAGEVLVAPLAASGTTWRGDYVKFGKNGSTPITWQVLYPKGYANISNNLKPCAAVTDSADSILLWAEALVPASFSMPHCTGGEPAKITSWSEVVGDAVNKACLKYFLLQEQNRIKESFGGAADDFLENGLFIVNPSILKWQVFLLSAVEATSSSYGLTSKPTVSTSNLRSCHRVKDMDKCCYMYYSSSGVYFHGDCPNTSSFTARPALNLERDSILLISDYSSREKLSEVLSDVCMLSLNENDTLPGTYGVEWKLTLFAKEGLLPLPEVENNIVRQADQISFSYSFASGWSPETNHYLSAILVDTAKKELLIYKRLAKISERSGEIRKQAIRENRTKNKRGRIANRRREIP